MKSIMLQLIFWGLLWLSLCIFNCFPFFFLFPCRFCDEATSALDSTTEAEILNALKSLANNRTSIFIAHRLTTAMQCDEVYILFYGVHVYEFRSEIF